MHLTHANYPESNQNIINDEAKNQEKKEEEYLNRYAEEENKKYGDMSQVEIDHMIIERVNNQFEKLEEEAGKREQQKKQKDKEDPKNNSNAKNNLNDKNNKDKHI